MARTVAYRTVPLLLAAACATPTAQTTDADDRRHVHRHERRQRDLDDPRHDDRADHRHHRYADHRHHRRADHRLTTDRADHRDHRDDRGHLDHRGDVHHHRGHRDHAGARHRPPAAPPARPTCTSRPSRCSPSAPWPSSTSPSPDEAIADLERGRQEVHQGRPGGARSTARPTSCRRSACASRATTARTAPLDQKAAFLLNFDRYVDDQLLLGLEKLAVQQHGPGLQHAARDPRLLAVPRRRHPAPRAGHVVVRVNGRALRPLHGRSSRLTTSPTSTTGTRQRQGQHLRGRLRQRHPQRAGALVRPGQRRRRRPR